MERIELTTHAKLRMKERILVSEQKMQKLAEKAWNSHNTHIPKLKKAEYKQGKFYKKNRVCKELMGYIFIFAKKDSGSTAVLVTVI